MTASDFLECVLAGLLLVGLLWLFAKWLGEMAG